MNITHHKELVASPSVLDRDMYIPYSLLSEDIKSFLKEKEEIQSRYLVYDNAYYFFIYTDKGNRVDIEL
jgi:hypothetical protein